MSILVVAATQMEIQPFLNQNRNAGVLITGVGVPGTIFHLTKKLSEKSYDMAIQAGIAGSFGNDIKTGDVVIIEKDTFADLGIYEKGRFYTLSDAGFQNKNDVPFEGEWLVNKNVNDENFRLHPCLAGRRVADGLTVNTVTDDEKRIGLLREKFNAGVESMEGAAFHYVCLQQKINFLQLRSISNLVGERDKSRWKMKEAIQNLNDDLIKIVQHFR
ncbi:MAG TPA: futalosine hydrolase [Chitinophagaceae bacterium]|nr:futalosine hydrolase [Chitinophagaceae bacterium]